MILRIGQQFSPPFLRSGYGSDEGVRTHADTKCCFTGLHPNHCTKPKPTSTHCKPKLKRGGVAYPTRATPLITQSLSARGSAAVSEEVDCPVLFVYPTDNTTRLPSLRPQEASGKPTNHG